MPKINPTSDFFESGKDSAPEQTRWLNHIIDAVIMDFLGMQAIEEKVRAACNMDMIKLREHGITFFDYVKACHSAPAA